MRKYEIPKLDENTPRGDQAMILNAAKSVAGVARAALHPHAHLIEITGDGVSEPRRADIASAVAKIGYPLVEQRVDPDSARSGR